jgi:hypothetical protein
MMNGPMTSGSRSSRLNSTVEGIQRVQCVTFGETTKGALVFYFQHIYDTQVRELKPAFPVSEQSKMSQI